MQAVDELVVGFFGLK